MDMRKLVGRNFEKIRKEKGFTQERIAEISGFTQQYVSDLERGRRNPTIVTLFELRATNIQNLRGGKAEPPSRELQSHVVQRL